MESKIEFFDDRDKSLGTFDICCMSDHNDRVECARNNGINYFYKCVLDNGRVIIERKTDVYIVNKNNEDCDNLEVWQIVNF
jgi:hypothetical protein